MVDLASISARDVSTFHHSLPGDLSAEEGEADVEQVLYLMVVNLPTPEELQAASELLEQRMCI
jgi:hypothetical protein